MTVYIKQDDANRIKLAREELAAALAILRYWLNRDEDMRTEAAADVYAAAKALTSAIDKALY